MFSLFIEVNGEFADFNKLTRAMAWTKPYTDGQLVWAEMYQKNKFTEQSLDIDDGVSSKEMVVKLFYCFICYMQEMVN